MVSWLPASPGQAGLQVTVLQLGERERLRGDAALNASRWQEAGGDWCRSPGMPRAVDLIVDALFGTGLDRPVTGRWAEAITAINAHRAPCLAIDVPSGLKCRQRVSMGMRVQAAVTI